MNETYGVKDVAKRYGCGEKTVLQWIRAGLLRAIDTRRIGSGRPRWRITAEALLAFEMSRQATPPAPGKKRRRKPMNGERQRMFYL